MVSFCTFDSSLDSIVDSAVGSKRFRVCVKTRGGHSYNDFGRDNAIARLADIISRLYALQAPVEGGRTTYNVGVITGGTSVNTIAQQAEMLYEFRSESRENMDYMEKMFLDVIEQAKSEGADVSLEVIGLRPCGGDVDQEKERALVERAVRAVSGVTGVKPELHSGSTDCNIPLSLGIPSVCVGSFTGSGAHTRDEYVEAASLEQGYKVAFDMILGRD
jgi:di/tripeptidase